MKILICTKYVVRWQKNERRPFVERRNETVVGYATWDYYVMSLSTTTTMRTSLPSRPFSRKNRLIWKRWPLLLSPDPTVSQVCLFVSLMNNGSKTWYCNSSTTTS